MRASASWPQRRDPLSLYEGGHRCRGKEILYIPIEVKGETGVMVVVGRSPVDDDVGNTALDRSQGHKNARPATARTGDYG